MDDTAIIAEPVGAVMAYLEVTGRGAVAPTIFPLHDEVVIGRDAEGSLDSERFLCIPEHTVSRRHARLRRQGDTYVVEDLHSFNGTFLLGHRLRPGAWYPLRDGDELAVSATPIVFHSLLVPAAESAPSIIAKAVDATRVVLEAGSDDAEEDSAQGKTQLTVKKLRAMAQVGIALGAVTDRDMLIERIMNFIFDLFPQAERAFILLRKSENEEPRPVAARRRDGTVEAPEEVRLSRTIVDEVLNRKQSVLSVDTLADRHFGSQDSIIAQAIRSVMCVPLLLEGEVLGLMEIDTSSDPYAFKPEDLEILTGVCAETAVALKNFQLFSDIERLLEGFVRASVQAIEERDPVTAGHSFRVATYAEHLATAVDRAGRADLRHVSFSRDQIREIRYAALLHDFGKVGVREHVLRKEKKLHHSEMRLLEQRFKLARLSLELEAYRRLAACHCEREWSIDEFREEMRAAEAKLQAEAARLEGFLGAIRAANEPAVSHTEGPAGLKEVAEYTYRDADGTPVALLSPFELSSLCVSKGCLTQEERRQIESHVADSYSFLILIPWTRDLAAVPDIAHAHHEKLDGSGYPLGLRGDGISIQARILTICDIYDALTASDRPYKKAMSTEQALDLMAEECREGRLDFRLFDVFVDSQAWRTA